MGREVIKGRNITTHWCLDRWVIEEQGTYLQGKGGYGLGRGYWLRKVIF